MNEMAEKKNIPEIRFKGIDGAWDEKEIGMVLTEKKRPVELKDNEIYELVTVKRRNEGVVSRGFLKGKDILVKNYFEVRAGDYIISKRQVIHGANGIVPQNLNKAIVSNEYLVSVDNEAISTEFWMLISKLPEMYKKFFLSSYGVDIEKLVFDVNDWKKRFVKIPSLNEQEKIIVFFKKLDKLITLHQRKYDKLVSLKKAMFEKMFPKNGADVPEIRFKGFDGKWEERKLGEISPLRGGFAFQSNQYCEQGIPILKISNILSTGEIGGEFNFYEEQENDENFTLPNKAALMAMSGATTGKVSILNKNDDIKVYQNQRVGYFCDKGLVNYLFISTIVRSNLFADKLSSVLVAGAQPNVSSKEIDSFEFKIPKEKEEQTKIGNYFQNLDKLISLHQKELEKLKNIKKACLEKMFV